ncbi:hypothetical protein KFK09_020368 [Dendrobium nobile]|uniref:Uncharacterized protein n=1 Tax=Dendrobium nobile TaxID=94219 RepID=A0A8T3AZ47_DENNO|nr:hypothetical protein KFK09_020368 [Dendrobium nobile]
MVLEMESMATAIGVSVPVLRFLLCFVATIPVSFAWRFMPGPAAKHLYAAASGAFLSYLSFGATSNLLFIFPMTFGYTSMLLLRRYAGIFTFFAGFAYLISCDGLLKDESLTESQKKNRLVHRPTAIEYIGYCLCCGSHFAGPVYEMKEYLEWTEGEGIWSSPKGKSSPSPYRAMFRAIVQAAICMGIYLYLVPHFPLTRFNEPAYNQWGFWKRLFYQYMSGFTARWKYYFIWSISEASIIISGLGFSGWSDSFPPISLWHRAKNVDIFGVELATSAVQLPLVWNIQGLYPGYIIFFVQSALMIAGSRVIYRWQQAVSPKNALLGKLLTLTNFFYTLLVLNYSCIGFLVLSMQETLASYKSVYFVGTIVPILFILLGKIIKPGRPVRAKTQKSQ